MEVKRVINPKGFIIKKTGIVVKGVRRFCEEKETKWIAGQNSKEMKMASAVRLLCFFEFEI
jgi:hypothetical protein